MRESDDIESILNKLPHIWTEEEANHIKEYFNEQRPEVPKRIVKALWDFWSFQHPGQPLFDEVEENVALLLHARAYGERVPIEGSNTFFGNYLKEHHKLFAPLMPVPLTWGPRAVLDQKVLAGLNSPVMHAWIFVDGATIRQILIIGEGLPEIRYKVLSEAFMTALQLYGGSDDRGSEDMMNIGVLRIDVPGNLPAPLNLPSSITRNQPAPLSAEAAEAANEVLNRLRNYLEAIERDSGLVQVHEAEATTQEAILAAFSDYTWRVTSNSDDALLGRSEMRRSAKANSRVVTLIPYYKTREDNYTLRLTLNRDLLQTQAYKNLYNAYYYATIERIVMDAALRRDYYEQEARRLENERKEYMRADPEQRLAIWGPIVLLGVTFDYEMGVAIKLAEPKEMDTERYYQDNVPELIQEHLNWKERMDRIIEGLKAASSRDKTPLRRLAASRYFDAAIRARFPDESRAALAIYQEWCQDIQPLLWFEWRCLLQRRGIRWDDVFTRHTLFHIGFTSTQDKQNIGQLAITPYTVFDQDRSVTLFDSARGVMVVQDALDFATPVEYPGQPDALDDQGWQHLLALANQPVEKQSSSVLEERFSSALREELRKSPQNTMRRILKVLLEEEREEIQIDSSSESLEQKSLKTNLDAALRATAVGRTITRALAALSVLAFQTARRSLQSLQDYTQQAGGVTRGKSDLPARIALLRAVVECEAKGLSFEKELPTIFDGGSPQASVEVQRFLNEAENSHPGYVRTWINRLRTWGGSKAIGQLLSGLPQASKLCTNMQNAALLARAAAESARLARELEQAAGTLGEEQETDTMAFVKVGRELENILLAEYTGGMQDDLLNLIAVLVGQEPLQIPRI
jgi:hypothetical protein